MACGHGAAAGGEMKNIPVIAVRGKFSGNIEIAFDLIAALKDESSRAVAEEHTGAAVSPVDNGRKFFRADRPGKVCFLCD